MNTWKIIFFALTPHFLLSSLSFPLKNDLSLLEKIVNIVFRVGKICFVHDHTTISQVLEKALIYTNFTLNSISVEYLSSIPQFTEAQQGCSDTLVVVKHADTFLDPIFEQEFKKHIPDLFQPHTRMIFVYEKASNMSENMFMRLVYDFAIDVLTVKNLELERSSQFFWVENVESSGLLVKSLHRNKTILSVNNTNGRVVVNWSDFERKKWTPKFAPGSFFRISLFHCPPFWYVENGTLKKGLESRVLDEILKTWPVKYYIEEGRPKEDKWNYTLGLVEQRERDLAVCSQWLIRTVDRRIEFSYPIYRVCVTFLVKKPQLLPVATFLFQPFQANVYPAIFAVLVINRVLLATLKKLARWRSSERYQEGSSEVTLGVGSVNTLLFFWVVFCLLSSTYYSAGLTSTCTHPRVTHDINTLEDMVGNKISWVFEYEYYKYYFRSLDNPTLRALADLFIPGRKILDRTKDSAIYVKTYGNRYISEIEELPSAEWKYYKRLQECVAEYYAGHVLQKNSPFARKFREVSQRLVETGLTAKMFHNIYKTGRNSMEVFYTKYVDSFDYIYIDLQRLQGAFFLLIIGWLASLLVFVLECCYSK